MRHVRVVDHLETTGAEQLAHARIGAAADREMNPAVAADRADSRIRDVCGFQQRTELFDMVPKPKIIIVDVENALRRSLHDRMVDTLGAVTPAFRQVENPDAAVGARDRRGSVAAVRGRSIEHHEYFQRFHRLRLNRSQRERQRRCTVQGGKDDGRVGCAHLYLCVGVALLLAPFLGQT